MSKDMFPVKRALQIFLSERSGTTKDGDPIEGSRYITVSDTLAKEMVSSLSEYINKEEERELIRFAVSFADEKRLPVFITAEKFSWLDKVEFWANDELVGAFVGVYAVVRVENAVDQPG